MKLFLDTANIQEIREAVALGAINGVTTNPSLAAKENIGDLESYKTAILSITKLINGPISVEVTAADTMGMVQQAEEIANWHPNVVVKIPSTVDGFRAMAAITRQGIAVNQTLCFSVNQAILGAQAGARYVSPFVGRLDDEGLDGMQVVADIVEVFHKHGIKTQVLAASIRHPLHVTTAAKVGADVVTLPLKVLIQMAQHSLTDVGMARFMKDWQSAAGRNRP
ncbi:MAG: fructose-6-phosphate aldolase [Dehalococcoidia bacterium]|nr:fructose-6-phosphate aldolase [Dehalococcoidia bacterium]